MKNEDVSHQVINVAEKIGFRFQKSDILVARRLPIKPGRDKNGRLLQDSSSAKFVMKYTTNGTYSKNLTMINTTIARRDSILNEKLSQKSKRLFWLAQQKIKSLQYKLILTNQKWVHFCTQRYKI